MLPSSIEAIENDAALYEEKNFDKRAAAIDVIEFIDQADLRPRAEKIRAAFEKIDTGLFQRLRAAIRTGGITFKDLINGYVDIHPEDTETGYDNLDIFINGLTSFQAMPAQTKELEPEMVYYQKTPARIVFELVEKAHFTASDVFFDIGSGLGQVAILVNLLAGIPVRGVEIDPAFCQYAREQATDLHLSNVTFIHADARKTDYSGGTVFFMFTPFRGEILQDVLAILQKEAASRKIRIVTYGPCTDQVALQDWLEFANPGDRLGIFNSF